MLVKTEAELIALERAAARVRLAQALHGAAQSAPALANPISWIRRFPWAAGAVIAAAAGGVGFWIWRRASTPLIDPRGTLRNPAARQSLKNFGPHASWRRRAYSSVLRRARKTFVSTLVARLVWGATGRPPQDYVAADPEARWA